MQDSETRYISTKEVEGLTVSTTIERCGAFLRITADSFGALNMEDIKQAVIEAIDAYQQIYEDMR